MKFVFRCLLLCVGWTALGTTLADTPVPAKQPIVIDVRVPAEFAANHVVGAQNIDFKNPDFPTLVGKLDKHASYRVYCNTGRRAALAAELMQKLQFDDVQTLGGIEDAANTLHVECTSGPCKPTVNP